MEEAINQIMNVATITYEEACARDQNDPMAFYSYGRLSGFASALHFLDAVNEKNRVDNMLSELDAMEKTNG